MASLLSMAYPRRPPSCSHSRIISHIMEHFNRHTMAGFQSQVSVSTIPYHHTVCAPITQCLINSSNRRLLHTSNTLLNSSSIRNNPPPESASTTTYNSICANSSMLLRPATST